MSLEATLNYLQKIMASGEDPWGLKESKDNSCLQEAQKKDLGN